MSLYANADRNVERWVRAALLDGVSSNFPFFKPKDQASLQTWQKGQNLASTTTLQQVY